MPVPLRRSARLVPLALVLAGLLASCGGGEAASPRGPRTSDSPTATDTASDPVGGCRDVVPRGVVEQLGWVWTGPAREDRGGCLWQGPEGVVHVYESGAGFDRACARLRDAAPGSTFRARVDTASGLPACGYIREDDLGLSELALDVDGQVVSVSVAALEPRPPEDVRAALDALTEPATRLP